MKKLLYLTGMVAIILLACNRQSSTDDGGHSHEDVMLQLISYNEDYELFGEADPFVVNESSSILAHFTRLDDFSPLPEGSVTLSLIVGSKGVRQTLDKAVKPGIYSFNLTPLVEGKGKMIFELKNAEGDSKLIVEDIIVYNDSHEAIHIAEENEISDPNAIIFTKEQSWKVDFSTEEALSGEFGNVIKTAAMIQPAQTDKLSIAARTTGIVEFSNDRLFNGTAVETGQSLFRISGAGLAGENSYVRFVEAENAYLEAKANYERAIILAEDKIVTESELLKANREFESTKAIYESLKENFDGGEQVVSSPINGFISEIYVSNGEYVESGQALIDVARNERLILKADVQQKYANDLQNIVSANIRRVQDGKTLTLDELNGELSSFGRSVNPDNYMIPVRFEIDNMGFVPGSFVELYIITRSPDRVINLPNEALLEEQGRYFVMVQLTPEQFLKREVRIGASDGSRTGILDGINEGERIVTTGAILVKLSQSSGTLDPHAGHVH